MQKSNITPDELKYIAWILVDRHGDQAFDLAGHAIAEMRENGDNRRTDAWLALQSVIGDALGGQISRAKPLTLH